MNGRITGFFEFFKTAPIKMTCYGVACFIIGAFTHAVLG